VQNPVVLDSDFFFAGKSPQGSVTYPRFRQYLSVGGSGQKGEEVTVTLEELQNRLEELEQQNKRLQDELNYVKESPFLQSSIKRLVYEALIDREEVLTRELGKRINERHGTMYEIKTQAKRLSELLGMDADSVRIMVTEAVQNILEHGSGKYVTVRLEIKNDSVNPCLVSSFKHELPSGQVYTMSDINKNAMKGDVTSEHFDFESSRGRGEYIMKELTDERRIINGIEVNPDGKKVRYFKRILINYAKAEGPRARVTFEELKREIDRLDYEDVICCFHVHHIGGLPDSVTIATTKAYSQRVADIMKNNGFRLQEEENYYRTSFATYVPQEQMDKEQLLSLFARVRSIVDEEIDSTK
tara:strand:- start:39105 stop:40172 length:1068 start_codon:yes stop_codon:yes gene_type:complete